MPFTQLLPYLLPTRLPETCGILLPLTDMLTLVKYSHLVLQRAECLLIEEFSQSPSYWRLMISLGGSQRKKTEFCLKTLPSTPAYSTSSASLLEFFGGGPIVDKLVCQVIAASSLFLVEKNLSQVFRQQLRHQLHKKIDMPPSYLTRQRDGLMLPRTVPLGKSLFSFFRKSLETSSSAELSLLSLDVERNFNPEFKHIFCRWSPSCKLFWNTKAFWITPTLLRFSGAWPTLCSMTRLIPHMSFLHSIHLIPSPLIAYHFPPTTFSPTALCMRMVTKPTKTKKKNTYYMVAYYKVRYRAYHCGSSNKTQIL